ncbi:MAG: RdgB/HAM1 family non-canonical purine NTP pyrophosphatase [bacterium]|nr:RdgB/HAM1 family non-canonical purine NTP pyrophosphatase [bacterium]
MNEILIASNNSHKISEITSLLTSVKDIRILTFSDLGKDIEVIEDGATIEANAFKKAKEVFEAFNIPALSDDTGLFVDALNGEPGVYSARYAGEDVSYTDNCKKLLVNLTGIKENDRTAEFRSVICFYVNSNEYYFFEGSCKGMIIDEERGDGGFGYDSLFVMNGMNKTFSEISDEEKNKISHRSAALNKFKDFSAEYFSKDH